MDRFRDVRGKTGGNRGNPNERAQRSTAWIESIEPIDDGRVVAEISPLRPVASHRGFLAENPDAELRPKCEKDTFSPLLTESAFDGILRNRLTSRQVEILRAAYEAGYYEWPRGCIGKEAASGLGISSATFSEHVHAAERKLLALLFDPSMEQDPIHSG